PRIFRKRGVLERQQAHGENTAPVAANFLAVGASGAQAFMFHIWRKLQGLPEAAEKVSYKFTAPYLNRALVVFLLSGRLMAQICQPGELRVIVKDSQESPIFDAQVRI